MSWRVLIKSGWDRETAQTAIADLCQGDASGIGADWQTLRARFLTDRLVSGGGKRTLHRCTIFLPRFSPVREVSGQAAHTARSARELAAMEAVRELHSRGELDNFLRPSLDTRITKFTATANSEDWLVSRLAGDRVEEWQWRSLQTWRKPPRMRLAQNSPLALDVRMADKLRSAAGCGGREVAGLAGGAAGCGGRAATTRQTFWLHSFQMVANQKLPDNGAAGQWATPE